MLSKSAVVRNINWLNLKLYDITANQFNSSSNSYHIIQAINLKKIHTFNLYLTFKLFSSHLLFRMIIAIYVNFTLI